MQNRISYSFFYIFVRYKRILMKKNIPLNLLIVLFLGISMVSCGQSAKSDQNHKKTVLLISPEDLKTAPENIQLIDIRTPQEYAQGHIKNAVNIDFYSADFLKKMDQLDKNKDIYIYCRSGHRSGIAAKKLANHGFSKIYDLEGGINNWNTKHLKIIR